MHLGPRPALAPTPRRLSTHFRHKSLQHYRSMQGPRYVMLIHLTMMLSTVSGWGLPSDGEVNGSLVNKSEIADQVDDARDGHRRLKIGCDSSWSATAAPGPASPSILAQPTLTCLIVLPAATGQVAVTAAVTAAVTPAATTHDGRLSTAAAIPGAIRIANAPRATTSTGATAAVMAGDGDDEHPQHIPTSSSPCRRWLTLRPRGLKPVVVDECGR